MEKAYDILSEMPLIGESIERIRRRLYFKFNDTEDVLEFKAILYFLVSTIIAGLVAVALSVLYATDSYLLIIIIFVSAIIRNIIINILIGKEKELLLLMTYYIDDVKHFYHRYRSVDEAIRLANKKCDVIMSNHGNSVLKCLKNKTEYDKYFYTCENHFLKLFVYIAYKIYENGDTEDSKGSSTFISLLDSLLDEIYKEHSRKEKIDYYLKFGTIATTFPIIIPKIIEIWMKKYLPSLNFFYESSWGYLIKIFILVLCISCYTILKYYQDDIQGSGRVKTKEFYWEGYILRKLKFLNFFIKAIIPKSTLKIQVLLEDSGSYLKIEWLYLHKFIAFIVASILILGAFQAGYKANVVSITNNTTYGVEDQSSIFVTTFSSDNTDEADAVSKDRVMIKELKNVKASDLKNRVDEKLNVDEKANDNDLTEEQLQTKIDAIRIQKKISAIREQHLKIWNIIGILGGSFVFYNVPVWLLILQKNLRQKKMFGEVYHFEAIITMLINFNTVSVEMILNCLKEFSEVFYKPLSVCCSNYRAKDGGITGLNKLYESVSFPAFSKIVDNLIMTEKGSTLKSAFSSINIEKSHYKDKRNELSDREVANKIAISGKLENIPLTLVILLYLALPTLIYTFSVISKVISTTKNIK